MSTGWPFDDDSSDDSDQEDPSSEWGEDDMHDRDEEDDEEKLLGLKRSLLWLCQEGQLYLALKRIEMLVRLANRDKLRKEIFQVGRDKNYPLHEILMGGTSDRDAYPAAVAVLEMSKKFPSEQQKMLSAQPPSHMRTALHWAAWGNARIEILERLVNAYPEALMIRDKKNAGSRTPLEILKRYYGTAREGRRMPGNDSKISYLERATASWTVHRIQHAVNLSVNRYFTKSDQQTSPLVPFDKNHRKEAGVKPKPWFLLSVIGFATQREMKPLALRILSYLGGNAKRPSSRKRKRLPNGSAGGRPSVNSRSLRAS